MQFHLWDKVIACIIHRLFFRMKQHLPKPTFKVISRLDDRNSNDYKESLTEVKQALSVEYYLGIIAPPERHGFLENMKRLLATLHNCQPHLFIVCLYTYTYAYALSYISLYT